MAVPLNTFVGPGTFTTSYTGSGNVFIGGASTAQFPNQNNSFIVTNGTGAIIHGDMTNNNIAFGWPSLTGPNYQGGQGVLLVPIVTTIPSAALTGGLTLYTDGMHLMAIDTQGNTSISNIPPGVSFGDYIVYNSTGAYISSTSIGPQNVYLGSSAGQFAQTMTGCVAIGFEANNSTGAGTYTVALGASAGNAGLFANAVAVGAFASQNTGATGTICINASGQALDAVTENSFYVNPVRTVNPDPTGSSSVSYNGTTNELTCHVMGIASQKGSANQTISNNTNTTVVLGTAVINPTSSDLTMNLGASSITAANAGIYRINARVQWTSSPTSGRYQLILSLGGVSTYEIAFSVPDATGLTTTFTPGTDQGIAIDEVAALTAGTAILVVVNQNSGSSQTIVGGTTASAELIVQRIA